MKLKSLFSVLVLLMTIRGTVSCQSKNAEHYLSQQDFMSNLQFELNYEAQVFNPLSDGYSPFIKSTSDLKTIEVLEKNGNVVFRKTSYEIDSSGKFIFSTYYDRGRSNSVYYTYDKSQRLISIVDSPRVFMYTYDSVGHKIFIELKGVYIEQIAYSGDTSVVITRTELKGADMLRPDTLHTTPDKVITQIIKYNGKKLPVYKWLRSVGTDRYEYDSAGRLIASSADMGDMILKQQFYYDKRGLLIKKVGYTNDKPDYTFLYNYTFKMEGNNVALELIKTSRYENRITSEIKKTIVQYIFDKKGNWIKRLDKEAMISETIRKIEYY